MGELEHAPGPWEYVPSTEHHGPYVTSLYGNTVCDCYCMSNPSSLSVRNGGDSEPIHHCGEMADANARLIAAAPDLLKVCDAAMNALRSYQYGNSAPDLAKSIADECEAVAKRARGQS